MEILGMVDGAMDYAGEPVYSKTLWTEVQLRLLVRGLAWLDRQVRKAERREQAEVARSHARLL